MEIKAEQQMVQAQNMLFSTQLQQSLAILQFSAQQLDDFIQKEIEKNPLLEIMDTAESGECWNSSSQPSGEFEEGLLRSRDYREDEDGISGLEDVRGIFSYERNPVQGVTLHEHLRQQLDMLKLRGSDRKAAWFMIQNMDSSGYLRISKIETANMLNIDRKRVTGLLHIIQSFDPPGVGARSLRECLLLQLMRKGILTRELKTVIMEHLDDIAGGRLSCVAKKLGIGQHKLREICDIIKTLDPKPGSGFSRNTEAVYISPDLEFRKSVDGYEVVVLDGLLPRLRIGSSYMEVLKDSRRDPEALKFIKERYKAALWVIKAVEQRKNTLKKVAEAIMHHQIEFLNRGVLCLKPLKLRDIALETGMHESTVSRAIKGKYVQTDRGLFELGYFFDSGLSVKQGGELSSRGVKEMIKDIIGGSGQKPLKDREIAQHLADMGVNISRRTVAKYRNQMGIPGSWGR